MKKTTKDTLRALLIYNPHNLAERGVEPRVFVSYTPQETGRASQCAKWIIKGIGFNTNPDAAWYDYGLGKFR
jgi:hypothetical protein